MGTRATAGKYAVHILMNADETSHDFGVKTADLSLIGKDGKIVYSRSGNYTVDAFAEIFRQV